MIIDPNPNPNQSNGSVISPDEQKTIGGYQRLGDSVHSLTFTHTATLPLAHSLTQPIFLFSPPLSLYLITASSL